MKLNRFVFGVCGLLLALGLWLPATTLAAAPAGLPPRPTPTPTTAPFPGGTIILYVPTARADLWTVVQWQDGLGNWHDVEGWRSPLGEFSPAQRWQVWAVYPEHLGLGPFRWKVYGAADAQLTAYSEAFYLPKAAGGTVWVSAPEPAAPSPTPQPARK